MLRASMPEAAIHEDGYPDSRKHDVDFASSKAGNRGINAITQTAAMQLAPQGQFRHRVANSLP